MQDQSLDGFMHIMDCALQFDMPKLLACCEYHIAADPLQRFQPVSLRLRDALPNGSVLRIAEGLASAFETMAASPQCHCVCCRKGRAGINISVPTCASCTGKDLARALLWKYVPGPSSFLLMAHEP